MEPAQKAALESVERVTGFTGATTCPLFYVKLPHVHEAVRMHRWWERGQLHLIEPHPNAAQVNAIDRIQDGIDARTRDDFDRMEREADAATKRNTGVSFPGGWKP